MVAGRVKLSDVLCFIQTHSFRRYLARNRCKSVELKHLALGRTMDLLAVSVFDLRNRRQQSKSDTVSKCYLLAPLVRVAMGYSNATGR
jgi:hypothetical protein